jgi:protein involved in polysaccharide export with SLBB domain
MVNRRDVVRMALALPFIGFASAAAQEQASIFIFGYVSNPGKYRYKAAMTVGDALEVAGGFDRTHEVTAVDIIRMTNGEQETLNASLTDALLPNDSIVVR